MQSTRRDFLQTLLAMGGAAATLGALGCGDDDGPAGPDSGGGDEDAGGGTDGGGGSEDAGGGSEDAGGGTEDAGGGTEDAGGGSEDAGPTGCGSVNVTIGSNHRHVLMVPIADVEAGTERTYDIQGDSPHAHSVTVSSADFATLASGGTVMVTSTGGGGGNHTHVVTLMCAA